MAGRSDDLRDRKYFIVAAPSTGRERDPRTGLAQHFVTDLRTAQLDHRHSSCSPGWSIAPANAAMIIRGHGRSIQRV
jgi:hypothetical protein